MKAEQQHYEDVWTAELYDAQFVGRCQWPDAELWVSLAQESEGPALELAVGTGRVAFALARAGLPVTGLDRSAHMLAVARQRLAEEPAEVQARVTLVQAPMQEFRLDAQFGLIYVPARSFQILTERADQRRCLECCAQHLRPGGRLAFDVFHPKLSRLLVPGGVDEAPSEYDLPDGVRVREQGHSDYDLATQTVFWHARYEWTAANGVMTPREYTTALHYFFRDEVEWMLEACGFRVEALYGDFGRQPFTAESPEMIFVARKRP